MKLLLLSSSRAENSGYLEQALIHISEHLSGIDELLFVPYAGVSISYDDYTDMVQNALDSLGIKVTGIHQYDDPKQALAQAAAIAVGGGNTFHLLHQLYELDLLETIKQRVEAGVPYIGWSAGSNIAGASIRTTNDMPIIQPRSFTALNLIPYQLNPHYTDQTPPGHHGETRQMRIEEFMILNPNTAVIGIQEGSALRCIDNQLILLGNKDGYVFLNGIKHTVKPSSDMSEWLRVKG